MSTALVAAGRGTPAPALALPPGPLAPDEAASLLDALYAALSGFRRFCEDAADDAVQDACLAALAARRAGVLECGNLERFAVRVAYCRRAEYFRRRDRSRSRARCRADDLPARVEEDTGPTPPAAAVGRALALLTDDERAVVWAVWVEGATQIAAGAARGLSRGSAQRLLASARRPMLRAAQAAAEI